MENRKLNKRFIGLVVLCLTLICCFLFAKNSGILILSLSNVIIFAITIVLFYKGVKLGRYFELYYFVISVVFNLFLVFVVNLMKINVDLVIYIFIVPFSLEIILYSFLYCHFYRKEIKFFPGFVIIFIIYLFVIYLLFTISLLTTKSFYDSFFVLMFMAQAGLVVGTASYITGYFISKFIKFIKNS